jgi:hypothetical protein
MQVTIKCLCNTIIGILLICYIIYITNSKNKHQHLLHIFKNKIYRFLIIIIITFSAIGFEIGKPIIGGNYILAILLSITYLNSIYLIRN